MSEWEQVSEWPQLAVLHASAQDELPEPGDTIIVEFWPVPSSCHYREVLGSVTLEILAAKVGQIKHVIRSGKEER